MRFRFPDSEIHGSKDIRTSPWLIAAYYVLHRLCAPRHPPNALALTLDRSAFRSMPRKKASVWTTPYAGHSTGHVIHEISFKCRIEVSPVVRTG